MNASSSVSPDAIEPRADLPYRRDIDGLRGIAVIAVVLYHAFPSVVSSGFVGVDVFFVVSGFLITGIVLDDLRNARFRFAHFYARRIRRLFPALIVVLVASFAFAWVYLLNKEFRQFSAHVAAASVFASNFVLWGESGYFDTAAQAKPLLHLWSLGIEEQFYVAWPLVVWATWKRRGLLLAIVLVAAAASLALQLSKYVADPAGAFFSPATRFWELLAGVFLAVLQAPRDHGRGAANPSFPGAAVVAAASLITIAVACFAIRPSDGFPGWWAIAPVAATSLLIAAGPHTPLHQHFLASRGLVWVGLISYPLYLWHWPMLSFAHSVDHDGPWVRVVLLGVGVVAAALTWRYLERPIRSGRGRPRLTIGLLVGAMSLLGVLGLLGAKGYVSSIGGERFREYDADRVWTYQDTERLKPVPFSANDFVGAAKLRDDLRKYGNVMSFRWIPSSGRRKTLFVGDSHMEQYWARADQLILEKPDQTRSAVFLTASSFLPIPAVHTNPEAHPEFVGLAQAVISYALSDPDIDTVVFSSVWGRHMFEFEPLPAAAESPYYVMSDGRKEHLRHGRRANQIALASLADAIRTLRHGGKRVFLVQEVVRGHADVVRTWKGFRISAPPVPSARYIAENGGIRELLFAVARENGAEVLDPFPLLCPDGVECPVIYDGLHPVYMDRSHLSDPFVRTRATFLDRTLLVN